MFISKIIIYYSIIYLIYYIIKKNIKNEINNEIFENNRKEVSNKISKKNIKIKINKITKSDIDYELFNLSKKELKKSYIENIILDKKEDNISVNNYIVYNFNTKINYLYKINCKFNVNNINNINNIKLIITNKEKEFTYEIKNNINDFGFILDNNKFSFEKEELIYIYLYFDNNIDILINNFSLRILEKEYIKHKDPIIIFNINKKYEPLYLNKYNILDYTKNKDIDNNSIFFI
jgi:hypothetical protein